jgi:tetratricopeptide (TPR) repeat protein
MAYYNEGVVLINTGKPDEANAALDKAIAADPNNAEAYYQKGVNLLAKGTYDAKTNTTKYPPEAAQDLNKYLELKPDGPNAEQAKALIEQMGEKVTSSFKARKK